MSIKSNFLIIRIIVSDLERSKVGFFANVNLTQYNILAYKEYSKVVVIILFFDGPSSDWGQSENPT